MSTIYNMKIAITYEKGLIFQHFGKTPSFLLVEAEGKELKSTDVVSTEGSGHSALIQFLAERKVDTVICGGIGDGARNGLEAIGINVVAGQIGSAEAALHFYLNGDLKDNPAGKCNHHHTGDHDCGSHDCGSHSCH